LAKKKSELPTPKKPDLPTPQPTSPPQRQTPPTPPPMPRGPPGAQQQPQMTAEELVKSMKNTLTILNSDAHEQTMGIFNNILNQFQEAMVRLQNTKALSDKYLALLRKHNINPQEPIGEPAKNRQERRADERKADAEKKDK